MKYFLIVFLIHNLSTNIFAATQCRVASWNNVRNGMFSCVELTNLNALEKARANKTAIRISNSKIPKLEGHKFARFGATLVSLDLHESGVEEIDTYAFIGLTRLENLTLWGNKLRWISKDWFQNTPYLRNLDVSFNFIEGIDYPVFQMLPYLENFYFDYNRLKFIDFNMFAYLGNLKRVKFGKNPLSWSYRARLTWQLENQRVEYTEEWEDWGWMNVVIKDCIESGQGDLSSDRVLDCIAGKLLDFTYDTLPQEMRYQSGECNLEARRLVRCMRPKNGTGNTDNETVRRILEDYAAVLMPMSRSQSPFSTPLGDPTF